MKAGTTMINTIKLTPSFMKGILKSQFDLIAKHAEMQAKLHEMMASLCFHAPLVRPAYTRAYGRHGVIIEQPSHWLVYDISSKERVRAYADGTLGAPSVPPNPMGFMIPSGNTKTKMVHGVEQSSEPLFHTLAGKRYIGEFVASRACLEIWTERER